MTLAGRARLHTVPILVTVAVVVLGMTYCLEWGPVVRHRDVWVTPGDIWGAYRSAHFIAWGSLGSVYAADTRIVTFPGILLLFAPLALLTGSLGMSESFPHFLAHPTAWVLLGPFEIVIGCSALFALDALATRLEVPPRRRMALCVAEAVLLWPTLVIWGHPEDALALALGHIQPRPGPRSTGGPVPDGSSAPRSPSSPWWSSCSPCCSPCPGRRRAPALLGRTVLPAAVLLATPLIAQFHDTVQVLLNQPNFPHIDHTTPWTAFAPRLGGTGKDFAVAAGPGRLVALLAACLLGWQARRWRHRPELLAWAAALALALRCVTESVMDPYYVWPALALGLVLVGAAGELAARPGLGRRRHGHCVCRKLSRKVVMVVDRHRWPAPGAPAGVSGQGVKSPAGGADRSQNGRNRARARACACPRRSNPVTRRAESWHR